MFCARAVEELGLSVSDIYTHAEMAAFDGYGIGSGDPDMRWDLLYVPDYGDGGRLVPGGELIRGKTKYYRKRRERAPVLIKKDAVLTGDGVFTWE